MIGTGPCGGIADHVEGRSRKGHELLPEHEMSRSRSYREAVSSGRVRNGPERGQAMAFGQIDALTMAKSRDWRGLTTQP